MKKFVKILALLTACSFVMMFGMAAFAEVDTSEFVTIKMVVLGNPPASGQDKVVQEAWNTVLKEKLNAHLELQWVEWADWYTKYNLLLASGESLDLISGATTWLDGWPNTQRGAFLALDDMLPVYAPKTFAEIPPEDWEQCKYEGKIYMMPENDYTQWVNHGFFYRGDWAKEAGITEPITDWETFGKYLQGVKDNQGLIPWDVNGSNAQFANGWVLSHTDSAIELTWIPTPSGQLRILWGTSHEDPYTPWSPYFDDIYIDFAKKMKEWGDNGYWREDVLNFRGDARELLRAGKTGVDQHHTNTYRNLRVDMDDEQPGSELQFFAFADTRGNLTMEPITHGMMAIGAGSKHPERAMMVYEFIRQNEEFYRLLNYGIEGVHYNLVDGKRIRPEGYERAKHEFYSDFWAGRVDKFELPTDRDWDRIGEVYARFDPIAKPYPYGRFVFDKTPIEAELAAISDVINQLAPAIAYGKTADPVEAVEDLRKRLKLVGYDTVEAEVQRQLDEYKKMIEGE